MLNIVKGLLIGLKIVTFVIMKRYKIITVYDFDTREMKSFWYYKDAARHVGISLSGLKKALSNVKDEKVYRKGRWLIAEYFIEKRVGNNPRGNLDALLKGKKGIINKPINNYF